MTLKQVERGMTSKFVYRECYYCYLIFKGKTSTNKWCSEECCLFDKINFTAEGNCWEWLGMFNKERPCYQFNGKNKPKLLNELYIKYIGEIKKGYLLDRKCQNSKCVNPEHLEQVTQSQYMKARITKYENSCSGNLNLEIAEDIRKDKRSYRIIADDYNVSKGAISMIKLNKTWTHG